MNSPTRAVVIGGGITGCSIAFHLAKMGWTARCLGQRVDGSARNIFRETGDQVLLRLVPCVTNDQVVIYGGEAIWYDKQVISRVRSGGYGYTIGKNIALCDLPTDLAVLGTRVQIEIFGERVDGVVSPDPLYDPKGAKIKA